MNGDVSFNSNNLQTYDPVTGVGIIVEKINHTELPDQVINMFAVANANKSAIAGEPDSPSRVISISGTIKGSSVSDLAQRVDSFNAYFNGKDKNLDINYAGATRRYIATLNGLSVTVEGKKLYAPFTAQFICSNPFGMDTSATTLINQLNHTTATYTATPTIGGTAPYQLPVFTITLDALTGDADYIQISNDANNQQILLYGLGLAAGDVIVVDCVTPKVTLNGDEVDYNGTFLELGLGPASITYTDGFTTRTVDIVGSYHKRYK